jgi:hypothetical protein
VRRSTRSGWIAERGAALPPTTSCLRSNNGRALRMAETVRPTPARPGVGQWVVALSTEKRIDESPGPGRTSRRRRSWTSRPDADAPLAGSASSSDPLFQTSSTTEGIVLALARRRSTHRPACGQMGSPHCGVDDRRRVHRRQVSGSTSSSGEGMIALPSPGSISPTRSPTRSGHGVDGDAQAPLVLAETVRTSNASRSPLTNRADAGRCPGTGRERTDPIDLDRLRLGAAPSKAGRQSAAGSILVCR